MTKEMLALFLLLSFIIWSCVCYETIKSSEKINWQRLNILLLLGVASTIALLVLQWKGYLF